MERQEFVPLLFFTPDKIVQNFSGIYSVLNKLEKINNAFGPKNSVEIY